MLRQILAITRKELNSYFGTPLATIFLGTFLAVVLFTFFTIETFFARGIADVRPLFQWMPILLIFLLAALTMRQWSEEQRAGTQELLLTLPLPPLYLVLGKFLATMFMIAVALILTFPLPLTVSLIGNMDWGPVLGGYLAAFLMAAAYAAIGLFISSRTDNQIVALIATVIVGGFFYLLGTPTLTDFFDNNISEILWALGTGSRFESIERGVIDLRDLTYYLSLTAIFLTLNTLSLDAVRWSRQQYQYRHKFLTTTALLLANLILINFWLFPLDGLRLDLTAQREYTLSPTTDTILDGLQEPLLIRAYISEKTHPLLAPLVPQIRDMLREYEIAADGQIVAEVVDPVQDPEIEAEANQTYGIEPVPFQVADRYESSVISSYFDILIRYGDQHVVLSFQDLIQVSQTPGRGTEVSLRNLEYDLTGSIKKVVYGFQSIDAVLASLDEPARLTFYVTSRTIPTELNDARTIVNQVAGNIAADSNGQFVYTEIDLDNPNNGLDPNFLLQEYNLQPTPLSFFSPDTYYANMILEVGDQTEILYLPVELSEAEIRTTIESALKRGSTGFLKVVGLWTPPAQQPQSQFDSQPLINYSLIGEQLRQEYTVRAVTLNAGEVPADVDVLIVLSPYDLTEPELFAIDQYLMRGGSVILGYSPFQITPDPFSGTLNLTPANTANLSAWLEHHGVSIPNSIVMDPQNQPFPVQVARNAGGFQVQEIQALDYPFFIDVRPDGMNNDTPIMANIPALTVNWASPVEYNSPEDANREHLVLLRSSINSWLRTDTDTQPNFDLYPDYGFATAEPRQRYPLAISLYGQFTSYYNDKPSPFDANNETPPNPDDSAAAAVQPIGTIPQSPDSSRLIIIGSSAFLEDNILQLSSFLSQERFLNNLQFAQNAVDWSVEDLDLLAIRSRGTTTRVLSPAVEGQQSFWEIGNYIIALIALIAIYFGWRTRVRQEKPMQLTPITNTEATD
ncbi:MAG TPA: Gldg family protein [Anaerolineae bacterium]|nr:Gldg family protein [Anaerolineae bacterium]